MFPPGEPTESALAWLWRQIEALHGPMIAGGLREGYRQQTRIRAAHINVRRARSALSLAQVTRKINQQAPTGSAVSYRGDYGEAAAKKRLEEAESTLKDLLGGLE